MAARGPLIAALVVPGQPGHELLAVAVVYILEEIRCACTAQDGCRTSMVEDLHRAVLANRVVESRR